MVKILVSACLLGKPVRYDGSGKLLEDELLQQWNSESRLVPVCPELLAGFPTPRPPAEIASGLTGADVLAGRAHIVEDTGLDVTEAFLRGAVSALQIARENNCAFALLADGSPSCGSTQIYNGSFAGKKIVGTGVVTATLRRNGIRVFAESQIADLARALRYAFRGSGGRT